MPVLDKVSYTAAGAAEATGLSVETIRAAIRAGDLPVVKPEINGRRIKKNIIRRADLEAWLDAAPT